MEEFLSELLKARPDTLLVVGGLVLLLLAIVGNISDKIKAGKEGRIAAAVIGPVLLVVGLSLHQGHPSKASSPTNDGGQITTVDASERTGAKKGPIGRSAGEVKDACSVSPDTCKPGFVWREAAPHDHVCVTPTVREETHADNSQAVVRRNPNGGPYGADTCLAGFVWRDAFAGDHVCVTKEAKEQAASDDSAAQERNACS